MSGVAQDQLQGMLAGWKFNSGLGLARSEVKMRLVLWNRLIGLDWLIHIDQQMMMAAVLEIIAGVSYAHIAQTEPTPESAFDRGAILRPHEIEKGILWRGPSLRKRGKWQTGQEYGERDQPGDLHDASSRNAA